MLPNKPEQATAEQNTPQATNVNNFGSNFTDFRQLQQSMAFRALMEAQAQKAYARAVMPESSFSGVNPNFPVPASSAASFQMDPSQQLMAAKPILQGPTPSQPDLLSLLQIPALYNDIQLRTLLFNSLMQQQQQQPQAQHPLMAQNALPPYLQMQAAQAQAQQAAAATAKFPTTAFPFNKAPLNFPTSQSASPSVSTSTGETSPSGSCDLSQISDSTPPDDSFTLPTNAAKGSKTYSKVNKRLSEPSGNVRKPRCYACQFCPRQFLNLTCKVRHERTHTGEKPFVCKECGKCFRQNGTLTTHMRIHSGDKPFECAYCHVSFRHRSTVDRHVSRCALRDSGVAAPVLNTPSSNDSAATPSPKQESSFKPLVEQPAAMV